MQIRLAWPSRILHPNERPHYMAKHKATKSHRAYGRIAALEAGARSRSFPERPRVHLIFYPPDNRARDQDGMLSSCKAYLDGISDAMLVDDSRFCVSFDVGPAVKSGCVIVHVEEK